MKPVLCSACRCHPCACPDSPAATAGVLGVVVAGSYGLICLLAQLAALGWLS